MTATRQFLVTVTDDNSPPNSAIDHAVIAKHALLERQPSLRGRTHNIDIVLLPDLAADDADLQIGFRTLTSTLRRWDAMNTHAGFSEPVALSRGQIAALIAELSKEKPGRTHHVDQAALDSAIAIQKVLKDQKLHTVQKTARIQLIITDAICRCLPEEVA